MEALTTILDQNSSSTPIAVAFSSGVNDSNMDHGFVAYESRNKPGSENRVIFMNERELAYSRERVSRVNGHSFQSPRNRIV